MRVTSRLMITTAFALFAHQAMALTAEEVLANQTSYLDNLGITFGATQTRDGNVLTVSDMRYDVVLPFDLGTMSASGAGITLTENADGTVNIAYPEESVITFSASVRPDARTVWDMSGTVDMVLRDSTVVASGEPASVTYLASNSLMELTLTDLSLGGEAEFDGLTTDLFLSIADTRSSVQISTDGATVIQGESSSGLTITDFGVGFGEDEFGSKTVSQQMGNTVSYRLVLPETPMDLMNFAQSLRDGLSLSGTIVSQEGVSQAVSMVYGEIISNQTTRFDGNDSTFSFDIAGLSTSGTVGKASIQMAETYDMPALGFDFAGATYNFAFPISASPEPATAVYNIGVTGLTLAEGIWAMADPFGAFPHDPIDFDIKLSSAVVLKNDLLNITEIMQVIDAEQLPFDVQSVTVDNLSLSAVGAQASGSGSFTLDMTDLETFDGMPRPTGSMRATAIGLNALLDKAATAGFLTTDDVMQARLVMGMFATVTGEDTLESTLEINDQGHVIANGQRIQ